MSNKVALVRCEEYTEQTVTAAIDQGLSLIGGLEQFIPKGADSKVFLKPNLLFDKHPDQVVTTHPLICSVIARKIKEITGTPPLLGDSPGGSITVFKSLFEKTGMKEYEEKGDFVCNNLIDDGIEEVNVPDGKLFKKIPISKAILNADVLINLPKLKTHTLMNMTGAVKNLFGAIVGYYKAECHKIAPHSSDLAEVFIHLAKILKPQLTIIDAVMAMDGNGPGGGDPFPMKCLIIGTNPFAVDVVAALLINQAPESMPIHKMAKEFGVIVPSLNSADENTRLEIVGDPIESFDTSKFRNPRSARISMIPKPLIRFLGRYINVYPFILADKCVKCYRCIKACPVGALSSENKEIPKLTKSKCISCFCCQEICPEKSIELKFSTLAKLIVGDRRKSNE